MYERVQRPDKPKRDRKLPIAIAIAVLLLMATMIPILYSAHYQRQYRLFQTSLADSTGYAIQHRSLTMERGGETVSLDPDKGHNTFLIALGLTGAGRTGKAPARNPDVTLTYGNGASLELWGVELEGYVDTTAKYGLFLRYTYPGGKTYAYDTAGLDIEKAIALLNGD